MIDRQHDLPITRQAKALGISRGCIYYLPRSVSAADLGIMRRMDELHFDFPFAGSRMLRDLLNAEGVQIGRQRVATLMRRMGIEALYRRPNTSKPALGHKIYPYLLRKMPVTRPDQVWAMDITYIPMARGFVYLGAVVDWFSRRVLSWWLSITMETEFCAEALEEALAHHGKPEIFNTDQGSQFTSAAFTGVLLPTSRSAWTARAPGVTTFSSSGSGDPSNTRRSTCAPMTRYPTPAPRSVATSASTTPEDPIRALTGGRPIKPTSTGYRKSR